MNTDLILQRNYFLQSGIFGQCSNFFTLEHAYATDGGGFEPKVAAGRYRCARGMHRLHPDSPEFETFEVQGVPNFRGAPVTGILFHPGNWNADSKGCICVGSRIGPMSNGGKMLCSSDAAFLAFMEERKGIDSFYLTIEN